MVLEEVRLPRSDWSRYRSDMEGQSLSPHLGSPARLSPEISDRREGQLESSLTLINHLDKDKTKCTSYIKYPR